MHSYIQMCVCIHICNCEYIINGKMKKKARQQSSFVNIEYTVTPGIVCFLLNWLTAILLHISFCIVIIALLVKKLRFIIMDSESLIVDANLEHTSKIDIEEEEEDNGAELEEDEAGDEVKIEMITKKEKKINNNNDKG